MDVQITERNDNEIKFVLNGSNPQFANALRRIMIGEIPVLAVHFVDFTSNDSVLYNEVISHRLAMTPLAFDAGEFNLPSECKCEGKGCGNCQVVLALDKKGPCTVYSKDLKSSNKGVRPIYDNIPIVQLAEDQRLKFEATAQLGFGMQHAKWQASVASYSYDEPTKFNFYVESVCGLKPEQIVVIAADKLKSKAKEFEKAIEKL